ncbi:MAG TPA: hypothetical protein VFE63_19365 [Roseiarcus sp.]|jgi:hypothetical protein|nr:hypothetical protein [Roseiarcus sp.]
MRKFLVAAIAAPLFGASVAGCVGTQELPLAPNIARLDINEPGALSPRKDMLRRAAELTLQNGYSAFRLMPIYVETPFEFGVNVLMFHAGDPGAWGALDAAEVLAKSSW